MRNGNGAQIRVGTDILHLQLSHPWVSKHWRSRPQQYEAGLQPTQESAQLPERTPPTTAGQMVGNFGSAGSARLHNRKNSSRNSPVPESDPFVGGNPRNFSNMISHHPPQPHHLPPPPRLPLPPHHQHPRYHASEGYRASAHGQPGPFHPVPVHVPYASPSHYVPTYPPPPPPFGGCPPLPPVMSPPHLAGPPRMNPWPPGMHPQPTIPMIYTLCPEQPPHIPHPGGPHPNGHMPVHLGQPAGVSTGPRVDQMASQPPTQSGQPHAQHPQREAPHAQTKEPAEVCVQQLEESSFSRDSTSRVSHGIAVRLPSSGRASEQIHLEQQSSSVPQQVSNGEGDQVETYQKGRGHHETHIVGD